jgi:hypothetical protein
LILTSSVRGIKLKVVAKVAATVLALFLSALAQSQPPVASDARKLEQTTTLAGQGGVSAQYIVMQLERNPVQFNWA